MIIHVVKPGDSIYSISRIYGVPYTKIISDNRLDYPGQLVVGQTIVILDGRERKLGAVDVNGYAFPNIDFKVLQDTLPHLTYLSIFSHEVRPDGSLSTIEDTPLIEEARKEGVAPLLVITNIEEGGSFSSDLARKILTDEQVQNTLLNNILKTLKDKNYYGLDIDFEYLYPEDREEYNDFLRKVVSRLRPLGYTVTTALAPKTSANQQGLLYEAHDYPVHGALANHVIPMTYEWGFTYGPPMAVSPINEAKKVLDYAVSAIPRRKILMGMPNYGYDWTLPYVQGTAAKTLSNPGAVDLARRVKAAIHYDFISQAPHFSYYDSQKKQHVVWFEDARSVEAKLRLANQYRLGGISYWTINRYFPQNWLVLRSIYNIRKVL